MNQNRSFVRVVILTAVCIYAGLMWWAGTVLEQRVPTDAKLAELTLPASTTRFHGNQAAAFASLRSPPLSLDPGSAHVQFGATLLAVLTVVVAALLWWARAREAATSPPSDASCSPEIEARLDDLLEQFAAQQQHLAETQSLLSSLATPATLEDGAPVTEDDEPKAEPARSFFLAHVSHELRTPLHGILGHAQSLQRDTAIPQVQRDGIAAIERSGQRLLGAINDLIDLSRLEAGQLSLSQQACDLRSIVDEFAAEAGALAAETDIELRIHTTPSPLPWVISDGLRLRQLLMLLVEGTIGAAADAGPKRAAIDVSLRHVDTDLMLDFRPAPPVADPSVCAPSPSGHIETDRSVAYSLSSHLVGLFGGELRQDDSGGVLVRIPCATAESPAQPSDEPSPTLPSGLHCRLLLVGSEETEWSKVEDLLDRPHCTVVREPNIDNARQRMQQDAFDLVMMRIGGQDQTAQDDAIELRLVAAGDPRIVALSNATPPPDRAGGALAVFDTVLESPIEPAALVATLTRLLTPRGTESAEQQAMPSDGPAADWPQPLGRDTASQIKAALDLGDVDQLRAIAAELSDQPEVPLSDLDMLTDLANRFDFAALRRLAERLAAEPVDA